MKSFVQHSTNKLKVLSNGLRCFSTRLSKPVQREDETLWVKSPLRDVETVVGRTIPEVLRENMTGSWSHKTAYESFETGVKYTHEEVLKNAEGFGAALIKSGFKQNEIAAIVLPNIPEYATVMFGIWDAGMIASPVNPAYSFEETKRQIDMSDAVCIITETEHLETARKIKASNSNIRSIIVVGEPCSDCHTFSEMIKADKFGVELFKGSSVDTLQQVALLPFSSGTTGLPKGVMLTHSNLTTNITQFGPELGTTLIKTATTDYQERFLGLLPFFHSYGLATFLHANMVLGCHTMTIRKFEPQTLVDSIRKHKPTVLHLVTPLINLIGSSDDYGAKELEHLHTVTGGAAPIGPAVINRFLNKAKQHVLFQEGYGLTETSPVSHVLLPRSNNKKIGSCGTPVASTIMKIIDTEGKAVGQNVKGEILIKGPQVMKGYYKNEEATANTIDADGWLHTGDIGYYDNEGDLYIVDRLKELIKVQGFQVAPSELEDALRGHPNVADVAVIGVPDSQTGETPRAYVVKKENSSLTEQDIHQIVSTLSKHKQIRGGIEFRKSIPKAPSGKILRRQLKEEYLEKVNKQK